MPSAGSNDECVGRSVVRVCRIQSPKLLSERLVGDRSGWYEVLAGGV